MYRVIQRRLLVISFFLNLDETIRLSPMSAASGTFGKREAAAEEQYFRKLEQEKIEHLKHANEKK